MLLDHLRNRYTAKWWDPIPLEDEKIKAIISANLVKYRIKT